MGCEGDVIRIKGRMEKNMSGESTEPLLDLLKSLQELPVNFEVLQKTRIGMTVNALRKNTQDEAVITLAKALLRSWKKRVEGLIKKDPPAGLNEDSNQGSNGNSKASASDSKAGLSETVFPRVTQTTDSVRLKCR